MTDSGGSTSGITTRQSVFSSTGNDLLHSREEEEVLSLTTSVSSKKEPSSGRLKISPGCGLNQVSRARTPIFKLCDEDWQLSLSPGGCRDSNNTEEAAELDRKYVGLFLYYRGSWQIPWVSFIPSYE